MKDDAEIRALHSVYESKTGLEVALSLPRMTAWELWQARGWTEKDLLVVVKHIRKKLREPESAMRFPRLIIDLDNFDEWLAEAKALARQKKPRRPEASVLAATGRATEPPPKPVRSVGDVLKGQQALAELRKLRDSL